MKTGKVGAISRLATLMLTTGMERPKIDLDISNDERAVAVLKKLYGVVTGDKKVRITLYYDDFARGVLGAFIEAKAKGLLWSVFVPAVITGRGKYIVPGLSLDAFLEGKFRAIGDIPLPSGIMNYPVASKLVMDVIIHVPDLREGVLTPYLVFRNVPGFGKQPVRRLTTTDNGIVADGKFVYTMWDGEDLFWLDDFDGRSKVVFTAEPVIRLERKLPPRKAVSVPVDGLIDSRRDYKKFYSGLGYTPVFYVKNGKLHRLRAGDLLWVEPLLAPASYYLAVETMKMFVFTRPIGKNKVQMRVVVFKYDGNGFRLASDTSVNLSGRAVKLRRKG